MAAYFNGTVMLQLPSALFTAEPFTVGVWFRHTKTLNALLVSIFHGTTTSHYSVNVGGVQANNTVSNGVANLGTPNQYNPWTPILGIFASSSSRTISQKGLHRATNTTTVTALPLLDTTAIGGQVANPPGTTFSTGFFAEVAWWNCAFTQAEELLFSTGIPPGDIRPSNLVSWMRLHQRFGFNDFGNPANVWAPNGTGQPRLVTDHPPILGIRRRSYRQFNFLNLPVSGPVLMGQNLT